MNGIRSLNAGAYANLPQQDIRLSGDHRGTYTQRRRGIMGAAEGGRIGYNTGGNIRLQPHEPRDLLVQNNSYGTRPRYQPPGYSGPSGRETRGDTRGADSAPSRDASADRGGNVHQAQAQAVVNAAVAQAAEENKKAAERSVAVSNADLMGAVHGADLSGDSVVATGIQPMSQLISPADDDIDSLYSAEGADFTPTDTKTIADKAIDFYKKYSPVGMASNLLKKPVNQYEGIEGEDEYGHGDFQYTDVRDFSQGEFGTDYTTLDNEEQAVVDKAFYDSGGLSDSARDIGLPSSQMETVYGGPTTTAPTTTEDIPPLMSDLVSTTAPVDSAATTTTDFQDRVAEQIAKNEAAKAEMPFKDYYVGGDPTAEQTAFMKASGASPRTLGLEQYAAQGGRAGYDRGGVAGIRQIGKPGGRVEPGIMKYGAFDFVGDLLGKGAKAVKKIVKSPVGKAALLGAGIFGVPGTQFKGFMGSNFLKSALAKGTHHADPGWLRAALGKVMTKKGLGTAATLATLSPFLMGQEEEDENFAKYGVHRGEDIFAKYGGVDKLRADAIAGRLKREEFPYQGLYAAKGGRAGYEGGLLVNDDDDYVSPREAALAALYNPRRMADGGRIGYDNGGITKLASDPGMGEGPFMLEEFLQAVKDGYKGTYDQFIDEIDRSPADYMAQGGRIGAQEGGLMDLGGMEKDYRQEGGFVPIGGQEKADDVPARLSKNEFVFTADAVRAAGGGDIDAGAEVMENVMENLEAGGKVSEESQGLEGARGMFANAQQLEKRII